MTDQEQNALPYAPVPGGLAFLGQAWPRRLSGSRDAGRQCAHSPSSAAALLGTPTGRSGQTRWKQRHTGYPTRQLQHGTG
jgi:hypothetical protein